MISPRPQSKTPNPILGDWGCHQNAVAQKDQGHGKVLHDQGEGYQQPLTFRSGIRQVSLSVGEVSLYFLGGDPIPYFGLDPIDLRSSYDYLSTTSLQQFTAI